MNQLSTLSVLDNTRLAGALAFIIGCLLASVGGRSRGLGWLAIIGVVITVSVVGLALTGRFAQL